MSDNQRSIAAFQHQVRKANSHINRVCIEGLSGDNYKYIGDKGSKSSFAKFSIEVSEIYEKAGELKSKKIWVSIVCYGATADTADLYFKSGKHVLIEGRLSTSIWTDKLGNTRSSLQVVANCLRFLDSKQQDEEQTDSSLSAEIENAA